MEDNGHKVAFTNCAPFTKCITKFDGTVMVDAEGLDLVIPMYNLLDYSSKYSDMTCSLWFYSKDEATNFNADITNGSNCKFVNYKAKFLKNTEAVGYNGIKKW